MNNLLIIILRTIYGYLLLILMLKIMGKRELGELGLFDVVILMTLANITVLGIENYHDSPLYFIVPIIILTIIELITSKISLKVPLFRKIMDGSEKFIIIKGKLVTKIMKKENYNMNDLMLELRNKQIRNIDEVEYAILETNGRLSVFTYQENKNNSFPFPLILSGRICHTNLKVLGKSEKWLLSELKKLNITNIKDIFIVSYQNNKLIITSEYH